MCVRGAGARARGCVCVCVRGAWWGAVRLVRCGVVCICARACVCVCLCCWGVCIPSPECLTSPKQLLCTTVSSDLIYLSISPNSSLPPLNSIDHDQDKGIYRDMKKTWTLIGKLKKTLTRMQTKHAKVAEGGSKRSGAGGGELAEIFIYILFLKFPPSYHLIYSEIFFLKE